MGLPIYRDSPSAAPRAHSPSKRKHDPTAHTRSAIRRQPTIRNRHIFDPQSTVLFGGPTRSSRPRTPESLRNDMEAASRAAEYGASSLANVPMPPIPTIALQSSTSPPLGGANDEQSQITADMLAWGARRYGEPPNPSAFLPRSPSGGPLASSFPLSPPRPRSRYGLSSDPVRERTSSRLREGPRLQPGRPGLLPLPGNEVNGLGDRQRSWSPESEHDHWDTLLTTITPDPSLPSASSSFGPIQPTEPEPASTSRRRAANSGADTTAAAAGTMSRSDNHDYIDGQHRLVQERLHQHVREERPGRSIHYRPSNIPRVHSPLSLGTSPADHGLDGAGSRRRRSTHPTSWRWPGPQPSQTLASPSATSDSEEAASNTSGPSANSQQQGNSDSGTRTTVPPMRPYNNDVPYYVELEQIRANHAEQLRTFNDTYMDYIAMSSYTDRYQLEVAPDNSLSSTIRSLASTERLLRRNLARQERYLFENDVPSRWQIGPDDSLPGITDTETQDFGATQNPSPPSSNDRENTNL